MQALVLYDVNHQIYRSLIIIHLICCIDNIFTGFKKWQVYIKFLTLP